MPARQENNMKYFRRLRTVLQSGSDIVPFFHTACLPFMHCSNPADPNEHQRLTPPNLSCGYCDMSLIRSLLPPFPVRPRR
jgi:hypothetical protein